MALSGRGYCGIGCGGATVALSGRAHCGIGCGGATVTLGVVGLLWH